VKFVLLVGCGDDAVGVFCCTSRVGAAYMKLKAGGFYFWLLGRIGGGWYWLFATAEQNSLFRVEKSLMIISKLWVLRHEAIYHFQIIRKSWHSDARSVSNHTSPLSLPPLLTNYKSHSPTLTGQPSAKVSLPSRLLHAGKPDRPAASRRIRGAAS